MAIIYTYPGDLAVTGNEKVLVTVPSEENSLRSITLQSIANLKSNNSGVNRVFFADSIGLSPNATQAGLDPLVGTGVVNITGSISITGGGTGKTQADLTAANIGDILVVNANKDGYDFSAQTLGETYTFSTAQNGNNADLTLTDSQANVQTVQLVPGASGNITLTVDNQASPKTITIESAGAASNYTAGNGIAISNTNEISISLAGNSGLVFDNSSNLDTDLGPSNIGDLPQVPLNGDLLYYDSAAAKGASWQTPSFISYQGTTKLEHTDLILARWNTVSSAIEEHTNYTLAADSVLEVYSWGSHSIACFYVRFTVDEPANSTLYDTDEYLMIARKADPTSPILNVNSNKIGFYGNVGLVQAFNPANLNILTTAWQTMPTGVAVLPNPDTPSPVVTPEVPAQLAGQLMMSSFNNNLPGVGNLPFGAPWQTTFVPPTAWIKSGNDTAFEYTLAGQINIVKT